MDAVDLVSLLRKAQKKLVAIGRIELLDHDGKILLFVNGRLPSTRSRPAAASFTFQFSDPIELSEVESSFEYFFSMIDEVSDMAGVTAVVWPA